jgi:hypothetical protein
MKTDDWHIDGFLTRMVFQYLEQPQKINDIKEKIIESLEKSEGNHRIWFLLGCICYIEGTFDQSAECFLNCTKIEPCESEYYANLAFSLRQLGKYEESNDIIFNVLPNL